jgi:hypothetical protein
MNRGNLLIGHSGRAAAEPAGYYFLRKGCQFSSRKILELVLVILQVWASIEKCTSLQASAARWRHLQFLPYSSVASQQSRPRPTVFATVVNSTKQCIHATVTKSFSSTPQAKAPTAPIGTTTCLSASLQHIGGGVHL